MGDKPEGLSNASLNTSRVHPQDGEQGDFLPANRGLTGNDQQRGLDETAPRPRDGEHRSRSTRSSDGGR